MLSIGHQKCDNADDDVRSHDPYTQAIQKATNLYKIKCFTEFHANIASTDLYSSTFFKEILAKVYANKSLISRHGPIRLSEWK